MLTNWPYIHKVYVCGHGCMHAHTCMGVLNTGTLNYHTPSYPSFVACFATFLDLSQYVVSKLCFMFRYLSNYHSIGIIIYTLHFILGKQKTLPRADEYRCPFCSRTCSHKSSLETHIRVHTGEKPFKCEICGKCFAQRGTLKNHMIVHIRMRDTK